MMGSFGDAACYSFYANKNISIGEGGMLLTNDAQLAERVRIIRSHGMTTSAYDRVQGKEFYDVLEFGYNYRMDDIRAALALVQFDKLPEDIEHREKVAARYRENLKGMPGITIPFSSYKGQSVNHVFGILTDHPDRQQLRSELGERGVSTSMHYPPVHQFACYEEYTTPLPKPEEIGRREISLPIFYGMTVEQVDYVCHTLTECLHGARV
jgi:dTDP-4-amino-4,6-dideoxygalactose transaminase